MSEVVCDCCKAVFERPKKRFDEATRNNWKQFCSKTCLSKFRDKRTEKNCGHCGKKIYVSKNSMISSKTGKVFCSRNCSCSSRNIGLKRTHKEKLKISKSLRFKEYDKKCLICGKDFHAINSRHICCSKGCGYIFQFGSSPYTKEDCINKISLYFKENGTIPTSKMDRKLYSAANRYWGSWNKMIVELGYVPSTQWLSRKNLKCKDGHKADSISEMLVDDWLYEHKISHERFCKYPNSKCNCDFYLNDFNVWLEYFGLKGEHKDYDKKILKKRNLLRKENLVLVELNRNDLYPENRIYEKLEWVLC